MERYDEKIAKGLSDHPKVKGALFTANEQYFSHVGRDVNQKLSYDNWLKQVKGIEKGVHGTKGDEHTKLSKQWRDYKKEEVELDEGKYTQYSSLLVQKGKLLAKGFIPQSITVTRINKEIEKEKKKLGIEEDLEEESKTPMKMIQIRNGTKVLANTDGTGNIYTNRTQAHNAASSLMKQHKGVEADAYQSPFINKFHVRIKKLPSSIKPIFPDISSEELQEGRMKELHTLIQQGKSAEEIAKIMKLDVKTVKSLMPKEEVKEKVEVQVVKKGSGPENKRSHTRDFKNKAIEY